MSATTKGVQGDDPMADERGGKDIISALRDSRFSFNWPRCFSSLLRRVFIFSKFIFNDSSSVSRGTDKEEEK